jgi:polysaccharide export outer membrane protein
MPTKVEYRRRIVRVLIAGFVIASTHVAGAQQTTLRIAPRDQVSVAVFGVDKLSGKFPVDADGTLNYPMLGTIRVVGLTTRELEAEIGRRLKEDGLFTIVPQVTVELAQTPNKRVTVTGAVRSPGTLQYAGELTLLEALVRAGSPNSDAGEEVLVVRSTGKDPVVPADTADRSPESGNEVISVNLRLLEGSDVSAHNLSLNDGDLVIVQKALSVYISGHVRSPGAYRVPAGATVLQALSLAGGLNERGSTRGIRIIRNRKEVEDVNLETVVEPGDTVIIRASLF